MWPEALTAFEAYEVRAAAVLEKHGARIERTLRPEGEDTALVTEIHHERADGAVRH